MDQVFVMDGEWDVMYGLDITTTPPDQQIMVQEVILNGVPFGRSRQYQRLSQELLEGGRARGLRSLEEAETHYVQPIIAAYESIRRDGVKTKHQLLAQGDPGASDIVIVLDRGGSPILVGGKHRFAICQALAIEQLPVRVAGVHRHWAASCYRRFGGSAWGAVRKGIRRLPEVLSTGAAAPPEHRLSSDA
jgi:hypothetical protein